MMDWSMFVFCFVLVINLASSELGASSDANYDTEGLEILHNRIDHITSDGVLNHNNININGIPTQEGDAGNRTNGRLSIDISGTTNVNKITVNGNPILPGDELFRIQIVGSSNTNEITFNGTNSQPLNNTSHSSGVLNIAVLGTTTVNTININDRSIQPGAGLLHLYVPQESQSDIRVNGRPWEYWNV